MWSCKGVTAITDVFAWRQQLVAAADRTSGRQPPGNFRYSRARARVLQHKHTILISSLQPRPRTRPAAEPLNPPIACMTEILTLDARIQLSTTFSHCESVFISTWFDVKGMNA